MQFQFFKFTRPSWVMFAAALAGAAVALGATTLGDFDLWWHLRTGEMMVELGRFIQNDIFSYTAFGREWVNHEWLFEVMAWLLVSRFGLASLTILTFSILCLTLYMSFLSFKLLTTSRSAALWGTMLLLWGIGERVMSRPHIFTDLSIAYFCLSLHRFAAGHRKWLFELPVIVVFWINLHAGGLIGAQLVLAYAFGEALQKRLGGPPALPDTQRLHIWLVGLLCIFASMVNPYGADVFSFSLVHLDMRHILAYTQEWLGAADPRVDIAVSQIIFKLSLAVTLASFIVNRKEAKLSHLMLTFLTCLMILKSKRFTPHFLVVNLPIMFFNFKELARRIPITRNAGYLHEWGSLAAVGIISAMALGFGVPLDLKGARPEPVGFGASDQFTPYKMVDFLNHNDIRGRVLNDMGYGGYLIYRRWPAERVFVDGRTPMYGDGFYREFVEIYRNARNFEELERKYGFDYMVFMTRGSWETRDFHKYLFERPDWKLVYMQEDGMVYLKDIPRNARLIKKLALKTNPLIEEMKRQGK